MCIQAEAMIKVDILARALLLRLLFLQLPLSQAQNDDQATTALLAIKAAVGDANTNLMSWNTTSAGGPCNDKWNGVTCDFYNNIIGLNLANFGLKGVLPSDAFLKLTKLRFLNMSLNSLQSPFPEFSQLKDLQVFNFSSNAFREPFPSSLLDLTQLVRLSLDNNFLTGEVPDKLSNLQLLEEIWIGNSSLSGPLPKNLASLVHLQILSAWFLDLEQTLPPEWGVWVNITYINLHSSKLKGTLPPEWGQKFTKLQRLSLYINDLTGSIPESWKGMKSLREIKFKDNKLSGAVPSSFLVQLEKNNASVDFTCNYLSGAYPSVLNDQQWDGNCFETDMRSHDAKCSDERSCALGPVTEGKKSTIPTGAIGGIIVAAVVFLCAIFFFACWARSGGSKHKKRRRDEDCGDWEVPQGVQRYSYKEIAKATKSFDTSYEIGQGGFGKVYAVKVEDGKFVAIKRASDLSCQGTKEFHNEISLLSRLHHRHLVRLEGFCDDRDEQILVYEYMKNGNLHQHLFDKQAVTLNSYKRLEIALAVAQGLEYLHSFADPPVIHRDVKPSNILLDDNMIAKVSDFGISRTNPEMDTHVSTRPAGTAGYLDPEYFLRRQLTTGSDVYGYGVVLLELITGQHAIDQKRLEDYNLVGWVKPKLVMKGIQAIIDPRLGPNFPVEAYEEVAEIAVNCTAFESADRPSMQGVVSKLEHILSGLVPPQHSAPLSSPVLSPLLRETGSGSQVLTSGGTEPLSDVNTEFGFKDTEVEPR